MGRVGLERGFVVVGDLVVGLCRNKSDLCLSAQGMDGDCSEASFGL